jgi:uncharacterized membrane protein YfcA
MALSILFVVLMGALSGGLGAMLGLGGGVFLVPLLVLVLQLPFHQAAGISLMTVIATSSAVSNATLKRRLVNVRVGMVLEVVTSAGALAGGVTAHALSERTLKTLFVVATTGIALVMFKRLERRNLIFDLATPIGWFGSAFHDHDLDKDVLYRVVRLPLALGASFLAGNLSGLLGIGGGIIKVPVLNLWCGVPLRVATATSTFMLGVTALASVPIYYMNGSVVPHLAAAAVLGVLIGSRGGVWLADRIHVRSLKILMGVVLLVVAAMMLARME